MKTLTIHIYNCHISAVFNFPNEESRLLIPYNKLFEECKKDNYRDIYIDLKSDVNLNIYVKTIYDFNNLISWISSQMLINW